MIQSEKLLQDTQYTLTVTTSPIDATCTLTYNGVNYSTKSLTVPAGSTISYSIYYSTYGTTTGSIIMNANKTLNCNGTYSTSETDVSWSNPTLSSSSAVNGFSAICNANYGSRYAWKAFNGSTGINNCWESTAAWPSWLGFYNANYPIKVTSITFHFLKNNQYFTATSGSLQASNNGSSYTTLESFSIEKTQQTLTFTSPTSDYYYYYRLNMTAGGYSNYVIIDDCYAFGYYKSTTTTYYWDKTIF